MKIKNSLRYLILGVFVILLANCSDKTQDTKDNNANIVTSSPKIEIIKNENAQEVKVKIKKKSNKNQSYYLDYDVKAEYDLKSQPANKDASVRVRPRTVLDANMHIRSPYERVRISLIVKQLSMDYKLKCSPCHDDYANGVIGPSLLGKNIDFIYKKIIDFKTGVKSNPLMDDLIKKMSDSEIKDIATQIYKFNKEIEKIGARP